MTATTTPRLLVEGFECLEGQGTRRSLGMLDLTDPISEALMFRRLASPAPAGIPVRLFASALPRDAADVAWDGRLAIPGFGTAVDVFCKAVGGLAVMREFRLHLDGIRRAEFALRTAEELQALVAAATFIPPADAAAGQAMFYCHLGAGDSEYLAEADDAYGWWRYDEYVRGNPRPDADSGDPGMAAWSAAYSAWVRTEAPPMVFLTTVMPFAGIDAASIRDAFEDEGKVDVPALLESACDDHHEDAQEDLVDEDALHELVEAWLPHAAKGTPEDLALEAALADWNGRQTLHSFMLDGSRFTATSADAGPEEIARWCARHVDRAEQALAEARIWVPAVSEALDAVAPRAA